MEKMYISKIYWVNVDIMNYKQHWTLVIVYEVLILFTYEHYLTLTVSTDPYASIIRVLLLHVM